MTTYNTKGTCSRAINYEVADGVVTKCEIVGGCPGNTQGVAKLVVGRKVEECLAPEGHPVPQRHLLPRPVGPSPGI